MAELQEDHQRFIIRRLASFIKPKAVRAQFQEEFGFAISEEQCCSYDASTKAGQRNMGPKLIEYFWEKRDEYTNRLEALPMYHAAYRIEFLTNLLETNKIAQKIPREAAAIVAQIAKESNMGYKPKVRGVPEDEIDGWLEERLVKVQDALKKELPDEQKRNEVLATIRRGLEGKSEQNIGPGPDAAP